MVTTYSGGFDHCVELCGLRQCIIIEISTHIFVAADVVTTYSGGFNHCVELCGLTTEVRTGDLQELMDALLPGAWCVVLFL